MGDSPQRRTGSRGPRGACLPHLRRSLEKAGREGAGGQAGKTRGAGERRRPGPVSVGRPRYLYIVGLFFGEASVLSSPVAACRVQRRRIFSVGSASSPPPLLPLPPVGENWFYYDYFFFSVADLEEGCVRESGRGEEKIPVGWMGCVIRGLDFALFKTDLGLRLL